MKRERERTLPEILDNLNRIDTSDVINNGLNTLNGLRRSITQGKISQSIKVVPESKLGQLVQKLPNTNRVENIKLDDLANKIRSGRNISESEIEEIQPVIDNISKRSGTVMMISSVLPPILHTEISILTAMARKETKTDIAPSLGLSAVMLASGIGAKLHKIHQANKAKKMLNDTVALEKSHKK